MTSRSFFVTGTDTDVGKTFISAAILEALSQKGLLTAGFKPISAGCEETEDGLKNADALALLGASSVALTYDEVNPIAFRDPVAPHLAAARENVRLSIQQLQVHLAHLQRKQSDVLLVEGAGGWRLPLGDGHYLSELPMASNMPVILVVGMKLGCLNHAMLTVEAIKNDGLPLAGWVANGIDRDMLYAQENLHTLHEMIDAPCLGEVPYLDSSSDATSYLDVSALLGQQ